MVLLSFPLQSLNDAQRCQEIKDGDHLFLISSKEAGLTRGSEGMMLYEVFLLDLRVKCWKVVPGVVMESSLCKPLKPQQIIKLVR